MTKKIDMKQPMKLLPIIFLLPVLLSCSKQQREQSFKPVSWDGKTIELNDSDSLHQGSTYLSVYSDIYDMTDRTKHLLTATASIRNISSSDTMFIHKADYYNTEGHLIRSYIDKTIYVKPLETLEIVIYRTDESGGSGANFIFDWATRNENIEPHFEAVMIWTTGTQGISFVTHGVRR